MNAVKYKEILEENSTVSKKPEHDLSGWWWEVEGGRKEKTLGLGTSLQPALKGLWGWRIKLMQQNTGKAKARQ